MTKPTATDGYTWGTQLERDTSDCSGGTHGHVNTAFYSHTIAGKDVKQFEWNVLGVLDNYADAGENCGAYFQANKHGTGSTWGMCVEACDLTPGDASGLIGQEVDCWVSGPDNGLRFGQDIVIGDSRLMRGLSASDKVEGTAAIRIGTSNVSDNAKWGSGIQFYGNVDYIFDMSGCKYKSLIKGDKSGYIAYAALALSVVALILGVF